MNIKLERKIEVSKFKVILDIGQKEERSDIIALLLIAQSNNNQLSKKIICREFLFRDHDQMAENILRRCIEYEVFDNEYKITQEGFQAINDGMIYHYYNSVFYLYVTKDPLIPQKILNFEFTNENIDFGNEIRESDKNAVNLIDIPQWLKDLEKVEGNQLFNTEKTEINIKSISEKVELIENLEMSVAINITSKSCILKTDGIFNDQREISYFPKFKTVMHLLLKEKINEWDWKDNKFKVIFGNLSEIEKINFKKKIKFKNPSIPEFGVFNSMSFDVDIKPKTEFDANKWANWLLKYDINDFMFDTAFNERRQQISIVFPDFNIEFLSHNSLAKEMKDSIDYENIPNEFWFVQAPLDIIPIVEKENN